MRATITLNPYNATSTTVVISGIEMRTTVEAGDMVVVLGVVCMSQEGVDRGVDRDDGDGLDDDFRRSEDEREE